MLVLWSNLLKGICKVTLRVTRKKYFGMKRNPTDVSFKFLLNLSILKGYFTFTSPAPLPPLDELN